MKQIKDPEINPPPSIVVQLQFPALQPAPMQFSYALSDLTNWFREGGLTPRECVTVLKFHTELIQTLNPL